MGEPNKKNVDEYGHESGKLGQLIKGQFTKNNYRNLTPSKIREK